MIKGITKEDEVIIKSVIKPYKEFYDFYFYGSRVKGDYRFLSDLDIMIKGNQAADFSVIEDLKNEFDKSELSYTVNITDYYNMDEHFYKLIEKDLVKIE